MSEERYFIVTAPVRGTQSFGVLARSPRHAKTLVKRWTRPKSPDAPLVEDKVEPHDMTDVFVVDSTRHWAVEEGDASEPLDERGSLGF